MKKEVKDSSTRENLNNLLKKSNGEEQQTSIEEEDLSLFDGLKIQHFNVLTSKNKISQATVVLSNGSVSIKENDKINVFRAWDFGSVTALFKALDKAVEGINKEKCVAYTLDSIKPSQLGQQGVDSSIFVVVVLRVGNYKVRAFHIHKDMVKACFYAYVKAIRNIYNPEKFSQNDSEQQLSLSVQMPVQNKTILQLYSNGIKDLRGMILREVNLVGENLSGVNLSNADLTEANLDNAILVDSNLSSAILTKGILSEANLSRANLSRANLSSGNLKKAILLEADLAKADLSGVNLTKANLSGADLSGVNLTNANLSKANLTGVNLTTAKIDGANLSEANLTQADLRGLDLDKTVFCKSFLTDTKMPEIKIEIYGYRRIERIIQLFNQFKSNDYVIYAVHSSNFAWCNSEITQKFRQVNKELSCQGITIKRVFILPKDNRSDELNEIIEEQVYSGIQVRCISEDLAKNLNGYNLKKRNLLVCKNRSVPENSFTTMMIINQDQ
ncbi:MAG: hypothetical protein F6K10_15825 [Moorea sp. SIO2B7]|nr:hypothetical protein [Moorena sp. SIO2B7]